MLVLQEFLTKRLDLTGLDWTSKEMSGIIICTKILISSWIEDIFQLFPNDSK